MGFIRAAPTPAPGLQHMLDFVPFQAVRVVLPNVEIIKHALQKNGFGQIITSLSEGSRYVKGQFVELAESLKVCAKFDGYVASSRHDGDFFAVENVRPMLQKLASMGKCAMCELSHFNYVLRSCSVFLV